MMKWVELSLIYFIDYTLKKRGKTLQILRTGTLTAMHEDDESGIKQKYQGTDEKS